MTADGAFVYRLASGRIAVVVCALTAAVAIVATILTSSPDTQLLIPVAIFAGWSAGVLWAYPFIRVTDSEVVVRNTFHSRVIPLIDIAVVTGGRRLTITTFDGRKSVPVAAPGGGLFLMGAIRQVNTYGSSIVPVTRVDSLRMDSEQEQTPATVIARVIRRRIDLLTPEALRGNRRPDGSPRDVPLPTLNVPIFTSTIAVGIVSLALFLILA